MRFAISPFAEKIAQSWLRPRYRYNSLKLLSFSAVRVFSRAVLSCFVPAFRSVERKDRQREAAVGEPLRQPGETRFITLRYSGRIGTVVANLGYSGLGGPDYSPLSICPKDP